MTEISLSLSEAINRAIDLQKTGDFALAERVYREILKVHPTHFDANHLLGVLKHQSGQHEEAERFIREALAVDSDHAAALCNLAVVLRQLNRQFEALAALEKAVSFAPKFADAHYNRGNCLRDAGRLEEAAASYDLAISLAREPKSYNNRGIALLELRRFNEAISSFDEALSRAPDYVDALYNRANTLVELFRFDEALQGYDVAITFNPTLATLHKGRGIALHRLGRQAEAIASLDQALALYPHYAGAWQARASVLTSLGRDEDALADISKAIEAKHDNAKAYVSRAILLHRRGETEQALIDFDRAIRVDPEDADAYYFRGNLLLDLRRNRDALDDFERTLSIRAGHYPDGNYPTPLRPEFAKTYNNRAIALLNLNRLEEALKSCDQAITLHQQYDDAHNNRGFILKALGRYREAIASFETALALNPDYGFLLGALTHAKAQICDWQGFEALMTELFSQLLLKKPVVQPFQLLGLTGSTELQQKGAEIWMKSTCPLSSRLPGIFQTAKRDRVRIGYFSVDFKNHPLSFLTAEMFERHSRSQFEVIGLSLKAAEKSQIRQRIEASFDSFVELHDWSDEAVADHSRELGIDIAVDLGGYTRDTRPNIFAMRAAPIQVSYMGFPGTMGASYMDYLIGDQTVIPEGYEKFYTEKIVFMPHTYFVNDSTRVIPKSPLRRSDFDLPENAFVFCCFNNNWKILPNIFEIWMRLLQRVEESVLWLLEDNSAVAANLRMEAKRRGVSPDRLVFAKRVPTDDHLGRHRYADLFLDTLPYNAHTTASEALWCGLPIVTCKGQSFAGRVAASLLKAIDLPELITDSLSAYEELAFELATDRTRLASIKQKLMTNRAVRPLFDTRQFTSDLEAAYRAMYERYQAGLRPDHIYFNRV